MPIRPEELIRAKDEKIKVLLERLIQNIDKEMSARYNGGEFIYDLIDTENAIDISYIQKIYGEFGWEVKKGSDYKVGSYLRFKPI